MDVKSYCDTLRQDLAVWKAKIYDIVRAMDKMPAKDKKKAASSLEGLHSLVDNIESRIRKLETECPTDWAPDKMELEKRFKELASSCEMVWPDVSPDDLE